MREGRPRMMGSGSGYDDRQGPMIEREWCTPCRSLLARRRSAPPCRSKPRPLAFHPSAYTGTPVSPPPPLHGRLVNSTVADRRRRRGGEARDDNRRRRREAGRTYEASMVSTSARWKTRTLAACLCGSSAGWCLSWPYSSSLRRRSGRRTHARNVIRPSW